MEGEDRTWTVLFNNMRTTRCHGERRYGNQSPRRAAPRTAEEQSAESQFTQPPHARKFGQAPAPLSG